MLSLEQSRILAGCHKLAATYGNSLVSMERYIFLDRAAKNCIQSSANALISVLVCEVHCFVLHIQPGDAASTGNILQQK